MNGKPHFYRTFGYWSCKCDGFSGAGYSVRQAFESMARTRLWWLQNMGLTLDT
jgi:hypothetical protein